MYVFSMGAVGGGAWNRLVELLRYLDGRGQPCHLITYADPLVQQVEVPVAVGARNGLRLGWESYRILSKLDLRPYARVWLGSYAANAGLGLACYRRLSGRRVRMFSFLRGAELRRQEASIEKQGRARLYRHAALRVHRALLRFMLRSSDLLLVQTEVGLGQIRADFGAALPARVEIIPNNINATWIRERLQEAGDGSGAPVTGEGFRVCFVGRLNIETKGLDTVLQAAEQLAPLPVVFDVIGDGEDRARFEQMIRTHGLSDRIHLHGFMENPFLLMKAADLVVVPSRTDPLPNVILEAFALDKPVVGTRVDGIPYLLAHDELLFAPGEAGRLAGIIRRSATDRAYLGRLEALCREQASKFHFDWGERLLGILATNA
jgi:glycosyltransferase involved in cell wall biosynthesis